MADTLFKEVRYPLNGLLHQIEMGQLGLPDIQRPFVWSNTKVRNLFDSMYRGYPVGYFLFWQTGAPDAGAKTIGKDNKQLAPSLLIVDGQQRLTSLYAVVRRIPVLRENFKHELIRIAFNPLTETFESADALSDKNPLLVPDISEVFTQANTYQSINAYLKRLREHRKAAGAEVTEEEEGRISQAISRLAALAQYPFIALELSDAVTEEQVAEVFVRINSEGKMLNQSDFILTLMSVFWDEGRTQLEAFSRATMVPAEDGTQGVFNHIFRPDPSQLLRVDVGVAFQRGKLETVYSVLRGKDLKTGEFSAQRREEQFELLRQAQAKVLDETNWATFLSIVQMAGYRNWRHISSEGALIFAYQLFLLGRSRYKIEAYALKQAVARWLYMSLLTGRYTSTPESQYEADLRLLPETNDAAQFLAALQAVEAATLTDDYWKQTLPLELATSASRSPGLFAYYAALTLCDAKVLFSKSKVSELLVPPAQGKKSAVERHHLFPKAWLKKNGVTELRDTNQIANYALLEWDVNIPIKDDPPAQYWPKYAACYKTSESLAEALDWHALPEGWYEMDYAAFLTERRPLIAGVIRRGYEKLADIAHEDTASSASAALS
jgi:hypothetical protein